MFAPIAGDVPCKYDITLDQQFVLGCDNHAGLHSFAQETLQSVL